MPKPVQFQSREKMIADLRIYNWRAEFEKIARKHESTGLLGAIHFSVMGSTFRAFRKNKSTGVGPAEVFRSWAFEKLYKNFLTELLEVKSQRQYDVWLFRFRRSLQKSWRSKLKPLDDGPALQLVNLLAKELCCVPPIYEEHFEMLAPFLHVPLDSYTLQPLALVEKDFPDLLKLGITWRSATMGSVKTTRQYNMTQGAIRKLTNEADTIPIAYEGLMWDEPHPETYRVKVAGAAD